MRVVGLLYSPPGRRGMKWVMVTSCIDCECYSQLQVSSSFMKKFSQHMWGKQKLQFWLDPHRALALMSKLANMVYIMSHGQLKNCTYSGASNSLLPDWGNALSGISVIPVVDWYLLKIWVLDYRGADVTKLGWAASTLKCGIRIFKNLENLKKLSEIKRIKFLKATGELWPF